jgi:hypothetical protein
MLEKLAQDDWLQTRGAKAVSDAQYRLAEAQIANEPEEVIEKFERRLLLMVRYKAALENSFHRRLKDIEALLARAKREELQERTVFMRENALVQNILLVQEKRDVPPHLPWRPAASARRAFKEQQRKSESDARRPLQ